MYIRVNFQQGLPESSHTVVVSFGDPTGRLDVDFSARDISCRNLYAADTVVAKDVTARRAVRSEEFVPGLLGCGFRIGADGHAEMRSLTLHESLEVPELRYNKVTAVGGQLWVTSAGTIRTVTLMTDGTYAVILKLEEGEVHEFDVDDILWAEFKTPTGFQSGRYQVIENTDTSSIRITVLSGCVPQPSMTIVRTGNYTNVDRQNSIYLDGYHGYERIMRGVNTPEMHTENIVYQSGLLDGLTIEPFGELSGIGVLCSNFYGIGKLWVKVGDKLKETGAEFKVQADQIRSKVSQKDFDTTITQHARAIELKAESRAVNAIGDRVTTAEAAIRVTSEAITQTVRKGEVISSINQSAEDIKIEAGRILLFGDTTLAGMLSAGKIKAEYIDVENLVARKLRTAESGERVEINHKRNTIEMIDSNGRSVFSVGPYGGTYGSGDDPYMIVGNMIVCGQATVLDRFKVEDRNIQVGGWGLTGTEIQLIGPLDFYLGANRLPNGGTDLRLPNIPFIVEEGDIQALPAGAIFADAGQEYAGSYVLRIKA